MNIQTNCEMSNKMKVKIKEEQKEYEERQGTSGSKTKPEVKDENLNDLGDSMLYCIGGCLSHYESEIDRWDRFPRPSISYLSHSLTTPHWTTIDWPHPRLFPGTVVHDHKLFIFGGNRTFIDKPEYRANRRDMYNELEYSDRIDVFDLRARAWLPDLPYRRLPSRMTSIGVASLGEHIYICGGLSISDTRFPPLKKVEESGLFRFCPMSFRFEKKQGPKAQSRYEPVLLALNGFLYLLSGGEGQGFAMERYDPIADQWSTVVPQKDCLWHTSATVHRGKIYALSDRRGLEVYCPITGNWTWLAEVAAHEERFGALASVGGRLVSVGNRMSQPSWKVHEFDLDTRTWIRRADVNFPRDCFAVQAYNPTENFDVATKPEVTDEKEQVAELNNSVLYCIGGLDNHYDQATKCSGFQPVPSISYLSHSLTTPRWVTIAWPHPRISPATVIHDHKLYIFGGKKAYQVLPEYGFPFRDPVDPAVDPFVDPAAWAEYDDTIETFDLRTKSWLPVGRFPFEVHVTQCTQVCSFGDYIYFCGGVYKKVPQRRNAGLHRYCPVSGQLEQKRDLLLLGSWGDSSYVALLALDGYLYALHGGDSRIGYLTMQRYDPAADQWSMVVQTDRFARNGIRPYMSATVHRGKIYALSNEYGLDVFCPITGSWTWLANSPVYDGQNKMNGKLASINNRLLSVGSNENLILKAPYEFLPVYEFDFETTVWIRKADGSIFRNYFAVQVYEEEQKELEDQIRVETSEVVTKPEVKDEKRQVVIKPEVKDEKMKVEHPDETTELSNSVLYCIGGTVNYLDRITHRSDSQPLPSISYLCHSLTTPHWTTIDWPHPRMNPGTVIHDHKLYIFGGTGPYYSLPGERGLSAILSGASAAYHARKIYFDTMEVFDLRTKSWLPVGRLPLGRMKSTSVCSLGDYIYFCGPSYRAGQDREILTLRRYCPVSGQLEEKQQPLLLGDRDISGYRALLSLNGYLYAIYCGDDYTTGYLTMQRYDPVADQWSWVVRTDRLGGVYNMSVTVHHGKIYALCDRYGLEVFCPQTGSWTRLAYPPYHEGDQMLTDYSGVSGMLTSINDRLVSVGNMNQSDYGAMPVYEFDFEAAVWIRKPDGNIPRSSFAVQVYNPSV